MCKNVVPKKVMAALLIITNNWKELETPSIEKSFKYKQVIYFHAILYSAAVQRGTGETPFSPTM